MSTPMPPPSAGAVVTALHDAVEALAEALEHETAALAGADPETLFRAVETKTRALAQLESLARGTESRIYLQRGREGDAAAAALAARLADCEQHNAANGSALITARRQNERLLAALGRPPRPPVYGARGAPETAASHRTLGTA